MGNVNKIKNNKSGSWEVTDFYVSESNAKMFNLRQSFQGSHRSIKTGTYKKLTRDGQIIMSNTPAEINDHMHFIDKAKESEIILINGLGLGVALSEILKSKTPKEITIIEKSIDVIYLCGGTYLKDYRVHIINADAFEWKSPKNKRYNVVWHDIWDNICSDNLDEMAKLHRKYGRKTDWQDSWCKSQCKNLIKKRNW